jgi:hypothetical protein
VIIPLIAGWNIMGYPGQTPQGALTVFQPLIAAGTLVKVIDEAGNIIQYMPWGWVNNIGNLKPGEGYYIKVYTACSVTVSNLKGDVAENMKVSKPVHFSMPVEGNPYRPMAVALAVDALASLKMQPGDEIGVFDGDLCVGAVRIDGLSQGNMVIALFSDDPETAAMEGFDEGNKISFRYWGERAGKEINLEVSHLEGDAIFSPLGTFVGKLDSRSLNDLDGDVPLASLDNNHPNPCTSEVFIDYRIFKPCKVSLTLISAQGSMVRKVADGLGQPGSYSVRLDVSDLSAGVWICRLEAVNADKRNMESKKLVVIRP